MGGTHFGDDVHEARRRRELEHSNNALDEEYIPFVDVFGGVPIAVIVEVDLHEGLRILSQSIEHGEQDRLLPQGRSPHLKNGQEDLIEKDLDLFLQGDVSDFSQSACRTDSDLEFGAHAHQDSPEDLDADLEYLGHRADGVSTETEAEVLLGSVKERRSLIGRGRVDDG